MTSLELHLRVRPETVVAEHAISLRLLRALVGLIDAQAERKRVHVLIDLADLYGNPHLVCHSMELTLNQKILVSKSAQKLTH